MAKIKFETSNPTDKKYENYLLDLYEQEEKVQLADEAWKSLSMVRYYRDNGRTYKQVYRCNEDGLVMFEPKEEMQHLKFATSEQLEAKNREAWKDVISTLRFRTS